MPIDEEESYNIEPPQEELIKESLEAGVSLEGAAELSGVPSYEVQRYADENDIDYSFEGEVEPEEFHDWDERIDAESIGKLINSYLKDWKTPKEYNADNPNHRLSLYHSKEILSDLGLKVEETQPRLSTEERIIIENSKMHRHHVDIEPIEETLEEVQREIINGDYIVESELGLEDYITAMKGKVKDSRAMADTIKELTGLEREGFAEEIMEFRKLQGAEAGTPYVLTDQDINRTEVRNLRRIISEVHEDFEETFERNKSSY